VSVTFEYLDVRREGAVEHVTLNRPDTRNAFNETVIAELTRWAGSAAADRTLRAAILSGAGTVFSAGADLTWMARMATQTRDENVRDALAAAECFEALDRLPVPLIARVHGAALGGGTGLAAVCDVVVADEGAVFGFTEVKLGIIPAVIAPFVLAKIGRSAARELFLTGARFTATRAREIGLVHAVVPSAELDATVTRYVQEVLGAAPDALAAAKALIRDVWTGPSPELMRVTAEAIADRRATREGQDGMRAFLDKVAPPWKATT